VPDIDDLDDLARDSIPACFALCTTVGGLPTREGIMRELVGILRRPRYSRVQINGAPLYRIEQDNLDISINERIRLGVTVLRRIIAQIEACSPKEGARQFHTTLKPLCNS